MKRPKPVEEFGRDLVKQLHNEMLNAALQDWAAPPVGGNNRPQQLLEATGLSDEQRWLVWQMVAQAIETMYHRVIQFVDDAVASEQLEVHMKDAEDAEESAPWDTESIGMPYGFSANMLERYGIDPAALWEQAKSWTLPPGRREGGVVQTDARPPEMDRPRPTPEQAAAYAEKLRDGGRECPSATVRRRRYGGCASGADSRSSRAGKHRRRRGSSHSFATHGGDSVPSGRRACVHSMMLALQGNVAASDSSMSTPWPGRSLG